MVSAANCSPSAEPRPGCSIGRRRPRLPLGCLLIAGIDAVVGSITIGCCWSRIWPDSVNAFYCGSLDSTSVAMPCFR